MLQIKNISKQYKTGDLVQIALNDVSLNFRENEFVSILGPSGSGKTTLLNIVGGLDRYDSGDLIINNVSTKKYKDRDWDSYRNHTIGFVFQSYNLIPHQSVLANVELALTIGGISKKERKKRALDALEQVGLKEQAHKKPNQMSGGQMQRVAIARALVNNPDILLADEPTGALDTETSVQVMELLKEVANDRLVIMVTHNPELAENYSTRIVKLKDGKVIDDSNPFEVDTEAMDSPKHKNLGKASMNFMTALSLSLNNLMTKKARTILTAFAGSIGIIGIALILSLSTGFHNYINQIQEETLSSYPLSIYKETADMTSALLSMVSETGADEGTDIVKEQQHITNMFSSIGSNDMKAFIRHLEKNEAKVDEMVTLTRYQYMVSPVIYTVNSKDKLEQLNPNTLLSSISGNSGMSTMSLVQSSSSSVFSEMLDDKETLENQYDVLAGEWPDAYDEAIIVLSEPNGITDLLVYSLGLRDNKELKDMISDLMAGETVENDNEPLEFTYEELMSIPLKVVDESATYKYNEEYDIYEDMTDDEDFMEKVYKEAMDLKIVGIVCPKEGETSMALMPGVAYTKELTNHIIETAKKSEIVQKQLEDKEVNVFSGKRFDDEEEEAGLDFADMISVDTDMLSEAFGGDIDQNTISKMTEGYMKQISESITVDTSKAQDDFNSALVTMTTDMLNDYVDENYNTMMQCAVIKMSDIDTVVDSYMKTKDCKKLLASMTEKYLVPAETFSQIYSQMLKGILQGYIGMAAIQPDGDTEKTPPDTTATSTDATTTQQETTTAVTETTQQETTTAVPDTTNSTAAESTTNAIDSTTAVESTTGSTDTTSTTETTTPDTSNNNQNNTVTVTPTPNPNQIQNMADLSAVLTKDLIAKMVPQLTQQEAVLAASEQLSAAMTEAVMQKEILTKVGELTGQLMSTLASAFNVDQEKIAGAFQFDLSEEELSRLMETMMTSGVETNAETNLTLLGYQDFDEPSTISFYFKDFDAKEKFINFLDAYNEDMEKVDEEKVISYTDLTGILMSSVSTIVDSVTYVLIAFVSISLIVSSIMIGIITYISVLERTKEIGVLRAIGASKKNISSIFNAETFIVGLFSGALGIGVTSAMIPPINYVIHTVTNNYDINAVLPTQGAVTLVILSVILTIISGLIPSKQAAKKDPVLALRSE